MKSFTLSKVAVLAAVICMILPAAGRAQSLLDNTVSASGNSAIKKSPETLRLSMELGAKGSNLKDLLAKLAARRESVKKQLEEFGAAPASIEFGDAKIIPGNSDQRRQMEMMIRQRMKAAGKTASQPAPKKELLTVSVSLTAEWPLKANSADEKLLFVQDLREKIAAADMGGQKEIEKLSAEEQEMAEEEEAQGERFGMESETKFGDPVFLYVAKVTDEERTKALTEAFAKAKAEAARLGAAAGVTLGTLRQVADSRSFGGPGNYPDEWSEMDYSSNRAVYRLMQRSMAHNADNPDEAIGMNPSSVTLRIIVNASFAIK